MRMEQQPSEFFRDLFDSPPARQHVQAGDLTAYYLVNLLCQFVRPDMQQNFARGSQPLAFRLAPALEAAVSERRARLRSLGVLSLFRCGFFPDSFRRRTVDVDSYLSLDTYAAVSLGRRN